MDEILTCDTSNSTCWRSIFISGFCFVIKTVSSPALMCDILSSFQAVVSDGLKWTVCETWDFKLWFIEGLDRRIQKMWFLENPFDASRIRAWSSAYSPERTLTGHLVPKLHRTKRRFIGRLWELSWLWSVSSKQMKMWVTDCVNAVFQNLWHFRVC